MQNISLLVGLKNNLDYTKNFYQTTRDLYPEVEIVFSSYNSTDGTNEWLKSLKEDKNVRFFYSHENKTLSDTFNKCIELATKPYVVLAHNDMILTPKFIENLEKRVSPYSVIYYITIEPPIFANDPRPWKIVKDFGIDLGTLQLSQLYNFSSEQQKEETPEVLGTSFFMCVSRETLLDIGGLDPLYNPMFCEDDDLILRLKLRGLKTFIAPDVICYHFVSKTSRFSTEYKNKTEAIEINSNRNFIRKWGFSASSEVEKKYDIGLIVKNCTEALLEQLEPWCSTIYVDCSIENYISREQPNTLFNLSKKIKPIETEKNNDILIYLDGNRFKPRVFAEIKQLSDTIRERVLKRRLQDRIFILFQSLFGRSRLSIRVRRYETYEKNLVFRKEDNFKNAIKTL